MKLITRKNFISLVCISFTIMILVKLAMEKISGFYDPHYTENIFMCFGIAVLIPMILAVHYHLQSFPFIPVFIGQYISAIIVVLGGVWLTGNFVELASTAYRDMFVSITIPFIVCGTVYYIVFFKQIKKANEIIQKMNG